MHHTRRPGLARAIKIASLFFTITWLAGLSFLIAVGYAWYERSEQSYWNILIALLVFLFGWVVFAFWSMRTRCQLCMASLFSRNRCNKHPLAKKLFGSYRLRISVAVIIINRFRCFFCGEEFTCKLPPPKPDLGPVKDRPVTTMRRSGTPPKKH